MSADEGQTLTDSLETEGLTYQLRRQPEWRPSEDRTISCLVLLLTFRCPAACSHCVFSSGPTATGTLDADVARKFIAAAARQDPPPQLSFSGGEPFLKVSLMRELMAFGQSLGMASEAVTSCAWVRDQSFAHGVLDELQAKGLTSFCVSYDRFHAPFIDARKVRAAVLAALDVGLRVVINTIVDPDAPPDPTAALARDLELAPEVLSRCFISRLRTVPVGRARTDVDSFYYPESPPAGGCPFTSRVVTISPHGLLYPCCGSVVGEAPEDASLYVHGDLATKSVDEIAELLRTIRGDLFFQLLGSIGPWGLLQELKRRDPALPLRDRYTGQCDACLEFTQSPQVVAATGELLVEFRDRLSS